MTVFLGILKITALIFLSAIAILFLTIFISVLTYLLDESKRNRQIWDEKHPPIATKLSAPFDDMSV